MKKLLFVLVFTFIGQQAFSQMYIVTLSFADPSHIQCSAEPILSIIEPNGTVSYRCLGESSITVNSDVIGVINQELNSIINQGYKLIETNNGQYDNNGFIGQNSIHYGTTWFLAIPWTSSSLEEVATTLKNLHINPNPATEFVEISLDYDLKEESKVVFISEAGYVSHKESVGEILKNEKYNIDISKIPAGKYLVTIVNGKTYTTPQKLIVL